MCVMTRVTAFGRYLLGNCKAVWCVAGESLRCPLTPFICAERFSSSAARPAR
jgi:hypothetical protein